MANHLREEKNGTKKEERKREGPSKPRFFAFMPCRRSARCPLVDMTCPPSQRTRNADEEGSVPESEDDLPIHRAPRRQPWLRVP